MVNGVVPDGWTWQTVEDLSKNIQYGYTESANDEPVGPKFLRITDIQDGKVNWDSVPYCVCSDDEAGKYLLKSGDIVFARTGATTGKSFLITNPPKAVFASYLIRLSLQEEINKKYFAYFLDSPDYWSQIMQVRKGSAQPGVNAAILAKLKVPIAPLPEQERIVAKIEELFTQLEAGTSALAKVQAGLRRYKASVLKAAVEGKLVENGKIEDGELPEEWRWVKLGELISDGPTNGLYLPKDRYGSGTPILRIDDYQNEYSKPSIELRLVSAKPSEIEKYSLTENDLIINRVNSPSHLGKSMVISARNLPSLFESNMMRIRLNKDIAHPKYVELYLHSNHGKERLISNAKWAVNQASINQQDVISTLVPLPPLEEQRRIVAEVERRLSVAREVESAVEAALVRAGRLRQSILKHAFEGKLL